MTTYNGWSNYETWLANLWIRNDEGLEGMVIERMADVAEYGCALDPIEYDVASLLSAFFEDQTTGFSESGFFADVINNALRTVNWNEIAKHFVHDCEDQLSAIMHAE